VNVVVVRHSGGEKGTVVITGNGTFVWKKSHSNHTKKSKFLKKPKSKGRFLHAIKRGAHPKGKILGGGRPAPITGDCCGKSPAREERIRQVSGNTKYPLSAASRGEPEVVRIKTMADTGAMRVGGGKRISRPLPRKKDAQVFFAEKGGERAGRILH